MQGLLDTGALFVFKWEKLAGCSAQAISSEALSLSMPHTSGLILKPYKFSRATDYGME